jgi:uncharacterized spore protein YtfJ
MATKEQATKEQATKDAQAAAESGVAGMLGAVADRIGANAGVRAVFGVPVERDGRTVIPVAQSVFGSGGGAGDSGAGDRGSGAGGGAMTRPVGYIEIDEQHAAFVPLGEPWRDPRLVLAYAFAAWLLIRALSRLLRG